MDVHPLRVDEAQAVASTLRHRVVVADRLERQRRDECLYLVAWEAGFPVGQALLHRQRPPALRVADRVDALPYLEDVFVVPDFRNLGIGTALLEAAERAAAARGDRAVSLAVSTLNSGARRLYARLGYVDVGVPVHRQPTSDPVTGSAGGFGSETVMDLVKRVDGLAATMRSANSSPGETPAAR
ncbi:MAG: GNAT family N-acetyltransferase [Candidatus Dormiibacterota bacterium]|jgi:GNAT superfamily N-acetyltransferase